MGRFSRSRSRPAYTVARVSPSTKTTASITSAPRSTSPRASAAFALAPIWCSPPPRCRPRGRRAPRGAGRHIECHVRDDWIERLRGRYVHHRPRRRAVMTRLAVSPTFAQFRHALGIGSRFCFRRHDYSLTSQPSLTLSFGNHRSILAVACRRFALVSAVGTIYCLGDQWVSALTGSHRRLDETDVLWFDAEISSSAFPWPRMLRVPLRGRNLQSHFSVPPSGGGFFWPRRA